MALILGKETIKRRIKFEAEGDEGEKIPSSFSIEIERPTKAIAKQFGLLFAKFVDLIAANQNADPAARGSLVEYTESVDKVEIELADFVKEKISNWFDVLTVDNQALEFSADNLDLLFGDQEARRAVFDDYKMLVSGRSEAAIKNSGKQEQAG